MILEVLNPPPRPFRGSPFDRNNNGLVLRLVYGDVNFLLAADIEALAENYLVGNAPVLESVVLKVPHRGSKTSSTVEFLRRVTPSQVVICAGVENQYRHPHAEVVARLEETPGVTEIYRTGQRGSIEFSIDGRGLWVKTQR